MSAILTGAWGGNVVLSELVTETSLFLPVQVPGGKMWTGKDALRSIVAEVWASEGAATRHLTLNSVLQPIAGNPAAVLATSTLLIVAPGASPQLQSVPAISQLVVKIDGAYRIARRTVHLL